MGIKNKKRMLVILLTIFCLGCGENGYNGDIDTEHSVSIGNDIYVQETEEDASADMDGWENKGEEQQYIWGSWTVTGAWQGNEWSEDSDWVGDTYELLPDSCVYEDKTRTDSAKLKGYYVTVAGENGLAPFNKSSYDLPGNYCLEIELFKADSSTFFGIIFGSLFLVARDEMIAISGRSMFRLEKTEDYDGETEGNGFIVSDKGIWYGDWEITEVLKANQDDAEHWIGQHVDMTEHENYHRVLMQSLLKFYLVDTEEKSIGKLVEAMGLEDEFFVAFYEFTDDYDWDQMIIKDEMTAVLVRDGNFFLAKRILKGEDGELEWIYGI